MKDIDIFCDGGSRGNPGKAGIGVVIKSQEANGKNHEIEISKYLGTATNNQAEYHALIEALKYLQEYFRDEKMRLNFHFDSLLLTEQLKGNYRVKNEGLKDLYSRVQNMLRQLNAEVTFTHVRREKNDLADKLANDAMDREK